MEGYEIKFNIYADSEQEAEAARQAIVGFIGTMARQGRAVRGSKIADAVARWDNNPFIRSKILEFFN